MICTLLCVALNCSVAFTCPDDDVMFPEVNLVLIVPKYASDDILA